MSPTFSNFKQKIEVGHDPDLFSLHKYGFSKSFADQLSRHVHNGKTIDNRVNLAIETRPPEECCLLLTLKK